MMQVTPTYQNVLRKKEFVVNFLSSEYDTNCYRIISNNGDDIDELDVVGLTAEASKEISTSRIKEAFFVVRMLKIVKRSRLLQKARLFSFIW